MSYIVESGSKQYIVELGQQIIVDRIQAEENQNVELKVVFSFNGSPEQKIISARVVKHQKGDKIRVVKFKSKSNYHRQYGFRAFETILEITDPSGKSVSSAKPAKVAKDDATETPKVPKTKKVAAAKTTTTKKPIAKDKVSTKTKAKKSE
jgi:large subunit ribosomal protein L21